MNHSHTPSKVNLDSPQSRAAVALLGQGATIPFIARYRKEATGGMDEVALTSLRDMWQRLEALGARRKAVLASLEERQLLTSELRQKLDGAKSLTELEDIYQPFRPKRRTRASAALEKGLGPLADRLSQSAGEPFMLASGFICSEKGVPDADSALAGARDIIAERVADCAEVRQRIRRLYSDTGFFRSAVIKGKEKEGSRYRDWFDHRERVSSIASHRMLAMRRGEKELYLNLCIEVDSERALKIVADTFPWKPGQCSAQMEEAFADGLKRLLGPRMETEVRMAVKERADREAIAVFALNLKNLLMAPPLGGKMVLAVDPGFRTGCKAVCLNDRGELLEHETIFPTTGGGEKAASLVRGMVSRHSIQCIAVGNGTGGRETERFLRELATGVPVVMVNESGASVYSASAAAREEFPELDITYRGAISIGRRLQDPLAELVKIDPESIGVGQYQHDVDRKQLRSSLDDTVEFCVNSVGVSLNTASIELLGRVSGLSAARAGAIIQKRKELGGFTSRDQLLQVPGIGPHAFQQCAGFLRIPNGRSPLDGSAVHPERYVVVERMAADTGTTVLGLMQNASARKALDLSRYVSEDAGMPTLKDIMNELERPGRDPRSTFEHFSFADVHSIDDLREGMKVPGVVTNVTDFGAFVDIGVHTDGLVHLSRLSEKWIKHPSEVVHTGKRVDVTVTGVDLERKRISLSMI